MVLFKDDEQRMKEQEKAEKVAKRSKLEKWIRRLFKVFLVLALLFCVGLWILSALGGNSDALKNGIEDYLSQATNTKATVTRFDNMLFFPYLKLDMGGITLDDHESGETLATIETIVFDAGFFDMMFSRQRIRALNLESVYVAPGVIGTEELAITSLSLKADGIDNKPAFVLDGRYGDQKISGSLTMEMEKKVGQLKPVFTLPKANSFALNFGEMAAKGQTSAAPGGGMKIDLTALAIAEEVISGEIIVEKTFSKNRIKGSLSFGDSRLEPNFKIGQKYLKGDLVFTQLKLSDIGKLVAFYNFYDRLPLAKESALIDLYDWNVDMDVLVPKLQGPQGDLGTISTFVMVEDQVMNADIKGDLSGGALSGDIVLDAVSLPASLSIKAGLNDWDYGVYQKAMFGRENVSGTANIRVSLNGKGKTFDALAAGLDGEAILIAGQGEMASSALNIWGAGLVNAMIPNLGEDSMTTLNCMIADFKITDAIAKPDPLFLDTKRVTVIGEGEINFLENKIDLKLEPKAKNPAFLDVATAVNVKGEIFNPKIGADTFSLFEKLGGLALGIVNPAFLAFTMTDLGITEDHPCHKFIGAPKEEEKEGTTEKDVPEDDQPAETGSVTEGESEITTPDENPQAEESQEFNE